MVSMQKASNAFAVLSLLIAGATLVQAEAPSTAANDAATTSTQLSGLPEGIVWETNMDDPPIGDPERAIRGGEFNDYTPGYPKTFRIFGPNSNEMWANWRNCYMTAVGLVGRHPQTDNYIPGLATHWSIQPDNKTVYFMLDPDARWSDGKPITSADYTFAFNTMKDPRILDPFINRIAEDLYEAVEAIDTHTIKVVGKQSSWRVLDDLALTPLPRHAINLDEGWEVRDNYKVPVTQGPYVIDSWVAGERVVLKRIDNWWGNDKHYNRGLFNPDKINVRVIADQEQAFDFFKTGALDFYSVNTAKLWATEMNFPEIQNGWVSRKQLSLDAPEGVYGIGFNLNTPILKNKDFRKAVQHIFDFNKINRELMFDSYIRAVSMFEGTMYENKDLKAWTFDPRIARTHLEAAGFKTRGKDGILTNAAGQRAAFSLMYSSKGLERHLTVFQNDLKRLGIDMQLQQLESSTYFEKIREKASEAFLVSMTAGFYPEPFQYFGSEFAAKPQTNNFWGYANPEVDKLIDIYRFDMDGEKRKEAMNKLDAILQEEALLIPFWQAPFMRFAYWNYVEFPSYYYPKRTGSYLEYPTFWINPQKKKDIQQARANGTKLPMDTEVEIDPHGVKPQ